MKQNNFPKWRALSITGAVIALIISSWFAGDSRKSSPLNKPVAVQARADAIAPAAPEDARPTEGAAVEVPTRDERIDRFREWSSRYAQATDAAAKARLESEGDALVKARREAMARLIEEDPQRALQEAMPFAERQQLPPSIASQLEQVVSGRGTLGV